MENNLYQTGDIAEGTVSAIKSYGAFIKFDNGQSGLLHISEMSDKFVHNVNNIAPLNEQISVKVIDVDGDSGFLRLSLKQLPKKIYHTQKRKRNREVVSPNLIDFTALENALPNWIESGLKLANKEQEEND